ncbi:MAG: diguanylate cyclase [Ruthenibacterium sp.]
MKEQDIDLLLAQIRAIILNQPISDDMKTHTETLTDLQEAISYLADCLSEADAFLRHLAAGNLDVKTPNRHNFLASNLKELHAGLRHITWQANQVANGDYRQKVSFLGEFSDSFNKMVLQLEERENALKQQTDALTHSMNLLVAVMDGLDELVIVCEKETKAVLYTNQAAQERFYNVETGLHVCGCVRCDLLDYLLSQTFADVERQFEFVCPQSRRVLNVKTFFIQWSEKTAFVHFISDITGANAQKAQLETMAFKDELTGLYNRRYGIQKLNELVNARAQFAVCMIDLDQLKKVNDRLGHTAGDEYITTVTQEMMRMKCDNCSLFRVGGDEFVMIKEGGCEREMRKAAAELERRISAFQRNYTLSISCGILEVPANSDLTVEDIMAGVDEKMYVVKNEKKQRKAAAYQTN